VDENNFVEIPNYEESLCFACGPANDKSLKMKFYGNNELIYADIAIPDHMVGWNGISHGGILSTLIDETMGWGAICLTKSLVLTKSMTVNYHKPVMVGEMLRVESRVKEYISPKEVLMSAGIYNDRGELCTSATGILFLMDKERITRLGFVDEKEIEFFWNLVSSGRPG